MHSFWRMVEGSLDVFRHPEADMVRFLRIQQWLGMLLRDWLLSVEISLDEAEMLVDKTIEEIVDRFDEFDRLGDFRFGRFRDWCMETAAKLHESQWEPNKTESSIAASFAAEVRIAIGFLIEEDQLVIILHFFDGLTVAEIGGKLEISETEAAHRLRIVRSIIVVAKLAKSFGGPHSESLGDFRYGTNRTLIVRTILRRAMSRLRDMVGEQF